MVRTLDPNTGNTTVLGRLRPSRVKGKPGLWKAQVPTQLHTGSAYLDIDLDLPREASATYALGVEIADP